MDVFILFYIDNVECGVEIVLFVVGDCVLIVDVLMSV